MDFDRDAVRAELEAWFFDEYVERWVAKGAGASDDDEAMILDYWNAPMFVCAPPVIRKWLNTPEHVLLFFAAQQEPLKAAGYTHTDIPDRRITVFTEHGASIEVIWSRCAGDREIERVAVNFEVARFDDRWKMVGIHAKYTEADTLDAAWAAPAARGPLSADPARDLSAVDPALRPVLAQTPDLPFTTPEMIPVGRAFYEFFSYAQPGAGVDVREYELSHARIRVLTPQQGRTGAALLWLHGGGLVAGRSNQLNQGATVVATLTGATVVLVDYRLAPAHPYPAALDDCHEAWGWIQNHAAELGIDPARVGLMGNSAGGGLAAALSHRLMDENAVMPAAMALFYPMLDDRTAADRRLDDGGHLIWSNACNRTAWNAYLAPHAAGDPELAPYASPGRREDVSGLPPTWIGVGGLDLFRDEVRAYAGRLRAQGVEVAYQEVPGAPHAFDALVPQAAISQEFVGAGVRFLAERLAAG